MQPLVTIAIPAYKGKYLEQSIRSALAQTYSNVEVLVVDDCSPNDLKAVVERFDDPRLRYIRNEQNVGKHDPSKNWNRCLNMAQGEWFCLLCDDDLYAPTFVETLLDLSNLHSQCDVLRSGVRVTDGEGKETSRYPQSPEYETLEQYLWDFFHSRRRQTISEFMLRRSRMLEEGGYSNMPYAWGSDNLSIFRFALQGGIASIQECLVTFRDSGENISSDQQHMDEKLEAFRRYIQETKQLIEQQHFRSDLLPVVDQYYHRACAAHLREADRQAFRHICSHRKSLDIPLRIVLRASLKRFLTQVGRCRH